MAERYAMYDPALRGVVLRLIHKWKKLPFSDLLGLMKPEDRLRFRDDVLSDLEWEGLIIRQARGDELVFELSERGQLMMNQGATQPADVAQPRPGER